MSELKYLDKMGTFTLDNPDLTSYMYFPLANEAGMMSAITPDLGGDIKLDVLLSSRLSFLMMTRSR